MLCALYFWYLTCTCTYCNSNLVNKDTSEIVAHLKNEIVAHCKSLWRIFVLVVVCFGLRLERCQATLYNWIRCFELYHPCLESLRSYPSHEVFSKLNVELLCQSFGAQSLKTFLNNNLLKTLQQSVLIFLLMTTSYV